MVQNKLDYAGVQEKAKELDFPASVVEFMEGLMGQPYGFEFPEPLRTDILRGKRKMDKRPGLYMEPYDFKAARKELEEKYGQVSDTDLASYAMYPKVFEDYKTFVAKYGDLSVVPTRFFLGKPDSGEEFHIELEQGKTLIMKLLSVGPLSEKTGTRDVFIEMNGEMRQVTVEDQKSAVENVSREKADAQDPGQIGAPMQGVVVEVRVQDGGEVKKGDPIAILSAMKMEMVVSAPHSGKVESLQVKEGDSVDGSDLICKIVKG